MDFIVPYDQVGVSPPGPWQNAAPSSGIEGSIPNADFFPAVQNEILNVLDEAGITRNAADFTQLMRAIRGGKLTYFADTGTADALVITPRTAHTALPAGIEFCVLKGAAANATTTPTLNVNGLVQTIAKRDGTPLAAGDLAAGMLFVVRGDGNKLRTIGTLKSEVNALVAGNNTINSATQTYIDKSTARGSTKLSAFTANIAASDIAVGSFSYPLISGSFTGASYVTVSGSCAMRNTDSSGSLIGFTARFRLTDLTSSATYDSPYLGGGSAQGANQIQLPFSVPPYTFGLNPAHTYNLSIICQKSTTSGAVQVYDPEIYAQHDGTNL